MLDDTDKKLLSALQTNAHLTAQELSDILHLSPSQAGRRRQRLEAEGYINSYRARVNPTKVDLNIQAFVQIHMAAHTPELARSLSRLLEPRPEVVCGWTLTGEADYLLRVFCKDLPALNDLIHHTLLSPPAVARVQSQIVMDQVKPDSPLPV